MVLDVKKLIVADSTENVEDVRIATYSEIINMICKYYGLIFNGDINSMDSMEVYGIARTLYDIFVARFTDYMFDMLKLMVLLMVYY